MTIYINKFAYRHWDNPKFTGTRITSTTKEEFIEHVRNYIESKGGFHEASISGYAPFCRHIILPNFTNARVGSILLTEDLLPKIKTGYLARRPEELPVLCRWIEKKDIPGGEPPLASELNLIFYNRDQILKENQAMGDENSEDDLQHDWGLISIKGQIDKKDSPMQPMTMMRNALGVEYGGSSEKINIKNYNESVEYWEKYISVQ